MTQMLKTGWVGNLEMGESRKLNMVFSCLGVTRRLDEPNWTHFPNTQICLYSFIFHQTLLFFTKVVLGTSELYTKNDIDPSFCFFVFLLPPPIHSFFWGAPSVRLLFLWCTLWLELWDFPITPQKPLLKRNGHLDPTNAPNAYTIKCKDVYFAM